MFVKIQEMGKNDKEEFVVKKTRVSECDSYEKFYTKVGGKLILRINIFKGENLLQEITIDFTCDVFIENSVGKTIGHIAYDESLTHEFKNN